MDDNQDPGSVRRDHRVTAARTQDPFDRLLDSLTGLPGGASTKLAAVQFRDFYDGTEQVTQFCLLYGTGLGVTSNLIRIKSAT